MLKDITIFTRNEDPYKVLKLRGFVIDLCEFKDILIPLLQEH